MPEPGWEPDPAWGPMPHGWPLWVEDQSTGWPQPSNFPQSSSAPPRRKASWPRRHPAIVAAGAIVALFVALEAAFGGSSTPTATTSPPEGIAAVPTAEPAAAPKPAPVAAAAAAPRGVTVSGEHANDLRIVSFKAKRNGVGWFAPVLRIKNTSGDSLSFVSVKVTALKGEDVAATASGIIESIDAGQTITYEPLSGDDFTLRAGLSYDVEIGG
jgi:hypothetical protein